MLAVRLLVAAFLLLGAPTATAVGYHCTPAFLVCVENEERDYGTCPHGPSYESRSVRVVPLVASASYEEERSCYHGPNGSHDDRRAHRAGVFVPILGSSGVEWSSIDSSTRTRCDVYLDVVTVHLHPICPMGPPEPSLGSLLP